MTAIKRCCALALAVLMILTALPVTAFAQAAEQEVNASLQETTVSGIANDIARQVLRSGQKNGEKNSDGEHREARRQRRGRDHRGGQRLRG